VGFVVTEESRPFTLSLLGGFSFETVEGEKLTLTLKKGEALLAYLATIPGHSASRESLASLLWSDSDNRRARQSLRRLLFDLARSFAPLDHTIIHVDGNRVSLSANDISIDVLKFDRLAESKTTEDLLRAAALYKGRFLKDFNVEAEDFENWLEQTRDRLEHKALNALANLLDQLQQSHRYEDAIETANKALSIDYFREDIHRQLMEIFMANGMRSSALSHYRSLKSVLSRELQVEPDADTKRLYEDILTREPESRAAGSRRQQSLGGKGSEIADRDRGHDAGLGSGRNQAADLGRDPGRDPDRAVQELFDDLLIGRQNELDGLMQLYRLMRVGKASLAAVTGPGGIGKSHLIESFLSGLKGEKVRTIVLRGGLDRAADLLPILFSGVAKFLSDDLADRIKRAIVLQSGPTANQSGQQDHPVRNKLQTAAAFEFVLEVLREVTAVQPLVLFVDDLERFENQFARRLFSLSTELPGSALLTVLSFSDDNDAGDSLAKTFLDTTRDVTRARLFRLQNLTENEVVRLTLKLQERALRRFDLRFSLIDAWGQCGGNPHALRTILARTIEKAEQRDGRVAENRLPAYWDDLSLEDKEAALLCAVLGPPPFRPDLLGGLSDLPEETLLAALDKLCDLKMLQSDGEELSFVDDSLRSLLYRQLPVSRRKKIHKAAMEWVRRNFALNLGPFLEFLSHHERSLGRQQEALFCELALAQRELEREHTGTAQKILEDIIEKARLLASDRSAAQITVEAYLGLATIAESHQDGKTLGSYLQKAQELVGPFALDYQAAHVNAACSRKARLDGEFSLACEFARRANRAEARSGVDCLWTTADRFFARLHLVTKSPQEVYRAMVRQMDLAATGARPLEEIDAASCLAFHHAVTGDAKQALASADRAMTVAERLGNERLGAACHQYLGMLHGCFGDYGLARREFERAQDVATVTGDLFRIYHNLGHSAHAYFLSDAFDEAEERLRDALKYAREAEMSLDLPLFAARISEVTIARDQLEDGKKLIDNAFRLSAQLNHHLARGVALRSLAQYLLKIEGRDQLGAEKALRSALSTFNSLCLEVESARTEIVLAKVLRASGKLSEARRIFRRASERFGNIGIAGESEKAKVLAEALIFS
jgi:DNA-binding SARP family transcriptional activator